MRFIHLLFIFFSVSVNLNAQVRWDGDAGDGQWTTALNWSNNEVPGEADNILLDNNLYTTNYTVTLPAGNASITVQSIILSPLDGLSIVLVLPPTNTSLTAFLATGPGDAILINKGGIFRNSSGAPNGTPVGVSTDNFFRINNGGRYIHNTERAHTTNLVMRLSTAPGTEQGIFEFNVPAASAYTVSVSGRTYGHLIFSGQAAGGAKTYTGAGISAFTVAGDLDVVNGATFSYGANTNTLSVQGRCFIGNSSTLNVANGSNSSLVKLAGDLVNNGLITETGSSAASRIELAGSSLQRVQGAGVWAQQVILTINNPANVRLLSPLSLPFNLILVNGHLQTDPINILSLIDGAVCSGGSASSFIEGPMKKAGTQDFTFPIGKGMIYAPIAVVAGAGAASTDMFIAEYIRSNPQSIHGTNAEATINHISFVEYWRLTREHGTSSKKVVLPVHQYSFAKTFTATQGGLYNGTQWVNLGSEAAIAGPPVPPYETGSFHTAETSLFGDFTLVSTESINDNPLPINFVQLRAVVARGSVMLEWTNTSPQGGKQEFQIQHSTAGDSFHALGTLRSTNDSNQFRFYDIVKRTGQNVYRLAMKNTDGSTRYSNIAGVNVLAGKLTIKANAPVGGNVMNIIVTSPLSQEVELVIAERRGTIMKRQRCPVLAGENSIRVTLPNVPVSIYYVKVFAPTEQSNIVSVLQ